MVDAGCDILPFELMMTLPLTTRFLDGVKVVAFTPPMVMLLHAEETLTLGWLTPVKLASPRVTFVVEMGTPAVQLPATFQLVLTSPVQLVCE